MATAHLPGPVENGAGPLAALPSLSRMAEIRVSAEAVAALGSTLLEARDALLGVSEGVLADNPWALGPGGATGALIEVLGNWRHRRLELARHLDDLGRAAQTAGTCYVAVEQENDRLLAGGQVR